MMTQGADQLCMELDKGCHGYLGWFRSPSPHGYLLTRSVETRSVATDLAVLSGSQGSIKAISAAHCTSAYISARNFSRLDHFLMSVN
jgi:hypothetical protein